MKSIINKDYEVVIHDTPIAVTLTYYSPGCAAKVWGPPEDCYPAESAELDWTSNTDKENFGVGNYIR